MTEKKVYEVFGTTLDRVKYLGHRMANTCERERANLGESKVACDALIEKMTHEFTHLSLKALSSGATRKFIDSIPEKALEDFVSAIPKESLKEMFGTIIDAKSKIAETKMAAESFSQCLIDSCGKDLPLPNIRVTERDGKTVFIFVIEEEI